MIEPSDRERAELPERSRQYMGDLEGELKRRVHERSAYLTIFHAAAHRWGREEMDHLVSDVDQGIGAHYHRYGQLEEDNAGLLETVEWVRHAAALEAREIDQALGAALSYPLGPDGTDVCTGDRTPVTLAKEAAREIGKLDRYIEDILTAEAGA